MSPENCVLLHQLFEEQAARAPDNVAVICGDAQLTYRELNEQSNQLAHYLQSLGVGPEVLVALCMRRTPQALVGLLAIVKAGGAYVPLDPGYPQERLSVMLADCKARILLTAEELPAPVLQHIEHTLNLEHVRGALALQPITRCASPVTADNLAYVIYTSGSTGKPKGVMIEHRGAVNTVRDINQRFAVDSHDRVLGLSALGFDLSVYDVFGLLAAGGCIVFVENAALRDPERWLSLLTRHGVTLWNTTPGAMQLLVDHLGGQSKTRLPSLRLVMLSGDWIAKSLPPQIQALAPEARVISLGGATEASIWSIFHPITQVDPNLNSIPYGRPLLHQDVVVLNEALQPCASLVTGEIYISGVGLARGYLHDEAKTRASFITHPETGQRLYRTGDNGRYLPDGNIEFLGRIDHQIKVRGFRVELGEIEAALSSHEAVSRCVIVARRDGAGSTRLIAYVVANSHQLLTKQQLSDHKAQHVDHLRMLYDATYTQDVAAVDPTFNIVGWNSSYTGLPIPIAEMHEWVDNTVARILELAPKRLLEIGCGTGLLLVRVAPHCQRYVATDISHQALRGLEQHLQERTPRLPQVALRHQAAAEFAGLSSEGFDTVVLNSVLQHFPDVEYLLGVVEEAVKVVRPGGRIFIGDVRSLPLLRAYHTSVQLYQAADPLSRGRMQRQVQQRAAQDEELLIDPEFFAAMPTHLPRISRVEVLYKRGVHHNEMTRFRYDVIIHVEEAPLPEASFQTLDWQQQQLNLPALRQLLHEGQYERLRLCEIPNARVRTELLTQAWLFGAGGPEQVGAFRAELLRTADLGVDPEELARLAEELSFAAVIYVSAAGNAGSFDAVLQRRGAAPALESVVAPGSQPVTLRPWHQYASDPMQGTLTKGLAPLLRNFLKQKLPDYMVPSQFVILPDLPLNENGKIDRKRLPEPEQHSRELAQEYVAPRTPLEEVLASIWSELLEVDQVGIYDNFFDLGGHSMLAAQVMTRIRTTLGLQLPLRWIFDEPTLASLAASIELTRRPEQGVSPPMVTAAAQVRPAPVSYDQQQVWVIVQMEPHSPVYNDPFTLRMSGAVDTEALSRSLDEIIRRHEMWRTTYDVVAGQPVQIVHPAAHLPLPVVDLTSAKLPEAEARRIATEELLRPFDLTTGPLVRALLLHLPDSEHRLYLFLHHSVFDGASLYNVFLRELHAVYQAFKVGAPSPLPEMVLQYADWAIWQRLWLTDEALEPQVRYWKQQLAGLPVLELPTDHPRPAVSTFRGARLPVSVPKGMLRQLLALAHQERSTLYMALLTSFQSLLYRCTGQDDIATGIVASSQNRPEVQGLIGLFVSSMLLRTDFSGAPSFRELLGRVRERVLLALSNKDVPLEKLTQAMRAERRSSKEPLTQTLFLLDPPGPLLDSGWWLDRMDLFNGTTTVALSLQLDERPEGLRGFFEYSPELFNPATIAAMAGHFYTLLESIIANPDQPVGTIPLLPAEQSLYPQNLLSRRLVLIENQGHSPALAASQERGKQQKAAGARHRLRMQLKKEQDG